MADITSPPTPSPLPSDEKGRAEANLRRLLSFRRQYDSRRALFYRQYIGQREARLYPDNLTRRSNTFMTFPFQNVETITSRVVDALFGMDPWFECHGKGQQDEPAAEAMYQVLKHLLAKGGLQTKFELFIRNVLIYGHAGFKVDWDWESDTVLDPQPELEMQEVIDPASGQVMQIPAIDPNTGAPLVKGIRPTWKQVPRACPRFTAIDIYDLLVDPDGNMAAQLTDKTLGQLIRENEGYKAKNEGQPLYDEAALAQLHARITAQQKTPDEVLIRIAELWDGLTGQCTILTFSDDREAISWKDLRTSYRNATQSTFRRSVYGGENLLLWSGPNPHAHKRVGILHTSYVKLPGEVFGIGAVEQISELTEAMNTFMNMIVDNWNLGINRRFAYDTNADIDHNALNNFNVPGGKVAVTGDPSKVLFPLPSFVPQKGDYAVLDVYKGLIESTSGISDFYTKGIGSPVGNRTATGISQVINESNFRFRMFIRNLELDVMQPLLQMVASMVQQYISDPQEIQITDAAPGFPKWPLVHPDELLGNFNFEFAAANYSANKVIRQRNLLAFANWAAQTPHWNQYEGLKEIAKVFEVRNLHKLLLSPEQVMQQQQMAQAQQIQMMIFEKMLDTESQARLSQARPRPSSGGTGKGGNPRGVQQEGKIRGAGLSSAIRGMAQSMGASGLGLEGLGEVNDN